MLRQITGRPIVGAMTRGGTDHRVDAYEIDGTLWHVWKDGEVREADIKARVPDDILAAHGGDR